MHQAFINTSILEEEVMHCFSIVTRKDRSSSRRQCTIDADDESVLRVFFDRIFLRLKYFSLRNTFALLCKCKKIYTKSNAIFTNRILWLCSFLTVARLLTCRSTEFAYLFDLNCTIIWRAPLPERFASERTPLIFELNFCHSLPYSIPLTLARLALQNWSLKTLQWNFPHFKQNWLFSAYFYEDCDKMTADMKKFLKISLVTTELFVG